MSKESTAPRKWEQRKEAKRNMYLTSTDQVAVQRRGIGFSRSTPSANAMCQKCLRPGHWTYECKNDVVYVKRTSRSLQLKKPRLRQPFSEDKPPADDEKGSGVEKKNLPKDNESDRKGSKKRRSRSRRRKSSSSSSSSDNSGGSDSDESDSSSGRSSSSGSSSSGSDSDSSDSSTGSTSLRKHSKKRRRGNSRP